jgi:hypothetical protein
MRTPQNNDIWTIPKSTFQARFINVLHAQKLPRSVELQLFKVSDLSVKAIPNRVPYSWSWAKFHQDWRWIRYSYWSGKGSSGPIFWCIICQEARKTRKVTDVQTFDMEFYLQSSPQWDTIRVHSIANIFLESCAIYERYTILKTRFFPGSVGVSQPIKLPAWRIHGPHQVLIYRSFSDCLVGVTASGASGVPKCASIMEPLTIAESRFFARCLGISHARVRVVFGNIWLDLIWLWFCWYLLSNGHCKYLETRRCQPLQFLE